MNVPEISLKQDKKYVSYTALAGCFKDFLQLDQPKKPLSIDWAEVDGLELINQQLTSQDTRPLTLEIFHSEAKFNDFLNTTRAIIPYTSEYIRVDSVTSVKYPNGTHYTLKGVIKQVQPVSSIQSNKNSALRGDGIIVLDSAGRIDKLTLKTTHHIAERRRASREVTLRILLDAMNQEELIERRKRLTEILYSSTHINLDTYGTGYFARSQVRSYSYQKPCYVIYDITFDTI